MIKLHNLNLHFSDRVLFDKLDLFVGSNDKIGLVGKNGAGKSTLLKTFIGLQKPDEGQVIIPKDATIGYLPQEMSHNLNNTIRQEAANAFEEAKILLEKIEHYNVQLQEREDYETDAYMDIVHKLTEANDRLTLLGIDQQDEQIERILTGLGFQNSDFDRKMSEFSGGWQMRVELAKILLKYPDLLLLDEPTNHLDIDSIEWLEDFLKNYPGALVLISHDKAFLDAVTTRTAEILNGKLFDYKAAYSKYLVLRQVEMERQVEEQKNQEKYIKHTEELINKFRAKKNKAAFAQSLIKKLDKLEAIEVDDADKSSIRFRFPPAPRSGKIVIETKKLTKKFGKKEVFDNLDLIVGRQEKIALIGKNGAGKTTLTKILVGDENYIGECELGQNVDIGYYAQNQAGELDESKTVFQIIDDVAVGDIRKNVRGLLGAFLFKGEDVDKRVSVLSGGEKARLALCKLLLHPYNLLILDEPTNHLDMRSKDVLKEALRKFDGTMIVVSHDRDFLKDLTDRVYELKDGNITIHYGDIYEFLKTKKANSIAEFERISQKKVSGKKENESKQDYRERKDQDKEKKRLANLLSKTEREISDLENEVAVMDKEMASLDYSDPEKSEKKLAQYAELKNKLEEKMAVWEKCGEEMEALEQS